MLSCISPASDIQITVLIKVTRALSTQLQRDWREVLSSCLHHNLAHYTVPCIEDVIKPLLQEFCRLWNPTIDHKKQVLVEG